MKKRGRKALVDSEEVGFRRGGTVLSSQSAFLATSSTSFLSWAPGDGDTYKCKTTHSHTHSHTHTHTHTQLVHSSSLPLLMPNCIALDFSIWDGTGYIWTTMNHCLFNKTLMQGHQFLSCLQLTVTAAHLEWEVASLRL